VIQVSRARLVKLGATLAVGLIVALLVAGSAHANYASLASGYVQHDWVTSSPGALAGMAMRPDNKLIVSAPRGNPWSRSNDGYLHLVPDGGSVDSSNRIGQSLDIAGITIRNNSLYAFSSHATGCGTNHPCKWPMYELDAETGEVIRLLDYWQGSPNVLVVDPKTNLLAFDEYEGPDNSAGFVTEYDPDTRAVTRLFSRDATYDSLGFSPDGETVFVGLFDRIQAYSRGGVVLYEIKTANSNNCCVPGQVPNGYVYEQGGSCFYDQLAFRDHFGNLFLVSRPSASSTAATQIATALTDPATNPVSGYMAADVHGNLVANLHDRIGWVGCTNGAGGQPPPSQANPPPGKRPPGSGQHTGQFAGGGDNGVNQVTFAAPAAPSGPGIPSGQIASGPQSQIASASQAARQAPSQVAYQASAQTASQGAVAPNAVGLADMPGEDPALSFSASGLVPPVVTAWTRLTLGAAATFFMAVASFVLAGKPEGVRVAMTRARIEIQKGKYGD
jgi:hypothetical protein